TRAGTRTAARAWAWTWIRFPVVCLEEQCGNGGPASGPPSTRLLHPHPLFRRPVEGALLEHLLAPVAAMGLLVGLRVAVLGLAAGVLEVVQDRAVQHVRAGGRRPQEQAFLEVLEPPGLARRRRLGRVHLVHQRIAPLAFVAGGPEVFEDVAVDRIRTGARMPQDDALGELLETPAVLRIHLFQRWRAEQASHAAHRIPLLADLDVRQHFAARQIVAVVVARLVVAPAAEVVGRHPLVGGADIEVGLQPPMVERATLAHFAAPGLAVHVVGALVQGAGLRRAGRRTVAGRVGPGVHPVARARRRRRATVDQAVETGPGEILAGVVAVLVAGEHAVALDPHAVGDHVPGVVARPLPRRGAVHAAARADALGQARRGVDHGRRPVARVAGVAVVLDADGVVVVVRRMPGLVLLAHHLRDLAVGLADQVVRRHLR